MRRLAEAMGMRASSLYKHIADKDELKWALVGQSLEELGEALTSAGPDLLALAQAYRTWALSNPHLYRLSTEGQLDRSRLPPGVEDRAAHPLWSAVGTEDRARAVWAAAHGLTILELDGRFPDHADLDAAWAALVDAFTRDEVRGPGETSTPA